MISMISTNKTHTLPQQFILITLYIICLVTAWQAVRFCEGLASFPLMEKPEMGSSFSMILLPYYYLLGIAYWLVLSAIILIVNLATSRIMVLGFTGAWAEFGQEVQRHNKSARKNKEEQYARVQRQRIRKKGKSPSDGSRNYLWYIGFALYITILIYTIY